MAITAHRNTAIGLGAPIVLLAGLVGLIGLQTGLVRLPASDGVVTAPETVRIASRAYSYRAEGSFLAEGAVVDGPMVTVSAAPPMEIMTYQVSVADYAQCVGDGACEPAQLTQGRRAANLPVTGVSFDDAQAYAGWLSARTGTTWRLPTVAEWVFAAGSRAADEALGLAPDAANPSTRWIAAYEREAAIADGPAAPLPRGIGGINEFGVADLAGAVWEWTASCDGRTTLGADGTVLRRLESCGAHYLEGKHRAAMTNFVRDAASGGCSSGLPPDNLGFRLVREPGWYEAIVGWLGRLTV